MSEKDFLTLESIVWSQLIVELAECFQCYVVNTRRHWSELNMLSKMPERVGQFY